jgi:exodeoxyribonuclease VII small subunit
MGTKKQSLEDKLNALNRIADEMEKDETPLEEMLKSFEEGVKLYRECYEILNQAEAKVQMIIDEMTPDDSEGGLS